MTDHVANRTKIIADLRAELVGPDPHGPEIELNRREFTTWDEANGPWRQVGSGEEILTRDTPIKRYGVGVLFPLDIQLEEMPPDGDDSPDKEEPLQEEPPVQVVDIDSASPVSSTAEAETDDFDLSIANAYQPSSMGVSFLAELLEDARLVVEATGGRYFSETVIVDTCIGQPKKRTWWLRAPVRLQAEFTAHDLTAPRLNNRA